MRDGRGWVRVMVVLGGRKKTRLPSPRALRAVTAQPKDPKLWSPTLVVTVTAFWAQRGFGTVPSAPRQIKKRMATVWRLMVWGFVMVLREVDRNRNKSNSVFYCIVLFKIRVSRANEKGKISVSGSRMV